MFLGLIAGRPPIVGKESSGVLLTKGFVKGGPSSNKVIGRCAMIVVEKSRILCDFKML